ncbi:MAG: 30S ribosome-binding factor RbfA [Bacteroidota bacterium]
MDTTRQQKVSKMLQKEISGLFINEFKDLNHGKMITVTVVRVTPDLGLAKVYLSIFPSKDSDSIISLINEKSWVIRKSLGGKIRHQVRKIPDLKFFRDDSLDYIENIDNLL